MRTALALGFFDGVHIAHQKIISAAVDYAREHGLRAAALTFDRPPASVLFGAKERLLTDDAEKRRLIEGLGAERRILAATPSLLAMSGASFVELLVREHSAAALFCGYNYTFGSDRLGAEELARLGRERGLFVRVLPEETALGGPVSSSRIRALLAEGSMEQAAELLGRPFSVTGTVERGKGLGRSLGFPTLNIYPSVSGELLPHGVYAARIAFGDESRAAVANFGINPTVGDKNIRLEAHILDYSGDLYGRTVTVSLCRFLRPERKFSSVDELAAQIAADARECRIMNVGL